MSQKLFLNTGLETIKGGALHALKDAGNAGTNDFATLTLTGVVVDQETFTLGGDVYEVNVVATDTGSESVAIVAVGDTSIVFDQAPAIVPLPGDVIRMESEFMIVVDYNPTGLNVNVIRGAFGSTEAEHSIANSDTFQAAQPVAAGNLAVPVSATAAATADGQIIGAVQFYTDGGWRKGLGGGTGVNVENGLKVDAFQGAGTTVVFAYPADGGVSPTDADDMTNATITDFGGGVEPASQRYSKVVVADDGSAFSLVAPFDVSAASVVAYGADGALVEAAAITATITSSRLVAFAGAGLSNGQTLLVGLYE